MHAPRRSTTGPGTDVPAGDARPLSAARHAALRTAGIAFLGLGAAGVVIPGLPTTPLVLMAAACFARSSPRLHRWLLANRVFGPLIRNWQEHRSISPQARRAAIGTIVTVGVVTVGLVLSHVLLRVAVGVTMAAVVLWLGRLPIRPAPGAE